MMKATGQRMHRSRILRRASSPEQATDATLRSAASVFRVILHFSFCIASLVLGFRLSRESLLVVVSLKGSEPHLPQASALSLTSADDSLLVKNRSTLQDPVLTVPESKPSIAFTLPDPVLPVQELKTTIPSREDGEKSSRVHVGRHDILIRPWPHPDPMETMIAQSLIARVQQEQRKLYGLSDRRPVFVITPTYRRSFQTLHLSSLMRTLMLVPGPLLWIVVEARERSAQAAAILEQSGLNYEHLYFSEPMPRSWPKRHQMEIQLRVCGLRFVREKRLHGIVVFADESNSHRLEFFEELQNVQWVGAFSVGLLMPSQASDEGNQLLRWNSSNVAPPTAGFFPIQGPACNQSGHLVGWHSESGSVTDVGEASKMSPNFEWAGFVLNSAAILDGAGRPKWIRYFDEWIPKDGRAVSPTTIVNDEAHIEPLGNCGRDVLLWWARIEARSDSKYPDGWVTRQQLEVVVPAKRTPWPEPLPPPPPPPPVVKKGASADLKHSGDGLGEKEKKSKGKSSHGRKQTKKGKPADNSTV